MPKTYKRKLYRLEHKLENQPNYDAKLTKNELDSLLKMGYALVDEISGRGSHSLNVYSYGDLVLLR